MAKKKLVKSKKLVGRSVRSRQARQKYLEEHLDRSEQAQALDDHLEAPIAPTTAHWEQDPNRWDIPGVDARVDWRHMDEKEKLKLIKSGVPVAVTEGVSNQEEEEIRLMWQKQRPFYAGMPLKAYGQWYDGIEQYNWAVRSGHKFGFNLDRPESSFIDEYNLKQYDIYGLKVIFLDWKNPSMRSAAGFYSSGDKMMAIPPMERGEEEKRRRTVVHEIGHHIFDNTPTLQNNWKSRTSKDKIEIVPVVHDYGGYVRLSARGDKSIRTTTGRAIMMQQDWMADRMPHRDINRHWKDHYQRRGARGTVLTNMLYNEAFAEAFRTYRGGQMKLAFKDEKKKVSEIEQELARVRKTIRVLEAGKKIGLTVSEEYDLKNAYRLESKWVGRLEGQKALIENYKQILGWMKQADRQGWYQGKDAGSVKFSAKHIRPVELKEADFKLYEADIEALKIGRKHTEAEFKRTHFKHNDGTQESEIKRGTET